MVPAEGLLTAHTRNWEMIDSALEGLEDLDLVRQPDPQCNSIAWILWHMSRVVDTFIHTRLQDRPQLWIQDGWHRRFGMAANPEDRGVGWTAQQVCDWNPPARDVQVSYYQAVRDRARQFMSSVTQAQLEEEKVIPPVAEPRTVAAALGQMTWDAVAHGGQIAYLRGLYRGMGWHR